MWKEANPVVSEAILPAVMSSPKRMRGSRDAPAIYSVLALLPATAA
jgi:hypothetical protein